MKQSLIQATFVILLIGGGALGLADGGVFHEQAIPTTSPVPSPASAERHVAWESLGGPYERVAYALAVAPDVKKSTLYMGTWGHSVYHSRVDHSQDGEIAWEPRSIDEGRYVRTLAVLPSSSKTVYAGISGEGVFRSIDGGKDWKKLGHLSLFAFPALQVESILILANDGAKRLFVGTRKGVWASDDLGEMWYELDFECADKGDACSVRALAHGPSGQLYVGTLEGLYGIQDEGGAWQFLGPPGGCPSEARHISSLAVLTDTIHYSSTLLIGTRGAGLYALDVATQTWLTRTAIFSGYEHIQTVQALLSTPNGAAYAGVVDLGVFESKDGGHNSGNRRQRGCLPTHVLFYHWPMIPRTRPYTPAPMATVFTGCATTARNGKLPTPITR